MQKTTQEELKWKQGDMWEIYDLMIDAQGTGLHMMDESSVRAARHGSYSHLKPYEILPSKEVNAVHFDWPWVEN